MQIDPLARTVRLSARELASFRNTPATTGMGSAPWRMVVGQEWHKVAETNTRELHSDARFEVTVKANYQYREWTFIIQGRIDQVIPSESETLLREVKTVRSLLPLNDEELQSHYPDYFAQAAVYLALARTLPEFKSTELRAEVFFIDIESSAVQSVPLSEIDESVFTQQLDTIIPFLNDRRECRVRLRETTIHPAFEDYRDGQVELVQSLDRAVIQSRTVLLEAPTGFGKTGIVLEHALRQMKNGLYERCIYLTSKSTGQLGIVDQLTSMIGDDIRYIQMRNRNEHRIESAQHTCSGDLKCNENVLQNWEDAAINPYELFADGTFTLEQAKTLGSEVGICPYTLTKSCLSFSEIWIGDSNYIFAPSSQSVFLDQQGFNSEKTILIIDEAHNLPGRVADALSVEINSADLLFALEEIQSAGASRKLVNIGHELVRCIDQLNGSMEIHANSQYELMDLCEDFSQQLKAASFDYEQCAEFAIEHVWRIPELAHRFNEPSHQWLFWLPKSGLLNATCLDPSDWIARCLKDFGCSILMSATLNPASAFIDHCGLQGSDVQVIAGHAPWRDNAYSVAIDCRVDTRYAQRAKYYELTAQTVLELISESPGIPIAVFFPSYQYAENIRTYIEAINPYARIVTQPRGVDLDEQAAFIDQGLLTADALFLILGSSYSEGVDKLGGKITSIMVVGPALPEVNPIQQAKMDTHKSLSREEQFRDVYILPAMKRVQQALGRFVRGPGHSARVLLHGKRYAEDAYNSALNEEYQGGTRIHNDHDLRHWLRPE